jgi:hypothetical protein
VSSPREVAPPECAGPPEDPGCVGGGVESLSGGGVAPGFGAIRALATNDCGVSAWWVALLELPAQE